MPLPGLVIGVEITTPTAGGTIGGTSVATGGSAQLEQVGMHLVLIKAQKGGCEVAQVQLSLGPGVGQLRAHSGSVAQACSQVCPSIGRVVQLVQQVHFTPEIVGAGVAVAVAVGVAPAPADAEAAAVRVALGV